MRLSCFCGTPFAPVSASWLLSVKRICGSTQPVTAPDLHALRHEYTRTIAPACALAAETPLGSPESIRGQTTAFDDAVEGAEGDRLAAVHGNDALPPIGMAPLLSMGQILGRHANSH